MVDLVQSIQHIGVEQSVEVVKAHLFGNHTNDQITHRANNTARLR
jgi:hypothetical protein